MNIFEKLNKSELNKIFGTINSIFDEFYIDYYIIGALARDIMLKGKYGIEPPQMTFDIDIAANIENQNELMNLKNRLLESGFKADKENGYRFYLGDTIIDILPFGGIENKDRTVDIPSAKGKKIISVTGLREIMNYCEKIYITEEEKIFTIDLPSICILKLISWNDKPAERTKDISDFAFILSHYSEINLEYILNNHYDIIQDWNSKLISSRVLGRDMRKIVNPFDTIKKLLSNILESNTENLFNSPLAVIMSEFNKDFVEENFALLKEIYKGFKE